MKQSLPVEAERNGANTAEDETGAGKMERGPGLEARHSVESVHGILTSQAHKTSATGSIVFYSRGDTSTAVQISYRQLYEEACSNSVKLQHTPGFKRGCFVLLYLDRHRDVVTWLWAILLANGIPVLLPTLSHVEEQRKEHLRKVSHIFESPLCITRAASCWLLDDVDHMLKLHTIEELDTSEAEKSSSMVVASDGHHPISDVTIVMLTSGSTGNPKAVCLTHRQILAAVSGKASVRPLPNGGAFLNWIGLDHVAGLIEIHLQAMWLEVDQVHVDAADVVASPVVFLELLHRHAVSRTFAPNFFLAKLVSACEEDEAAGYGRQLNLSRLTMLASGGEANDVDTGIAASCLLAKYGAPQNAIAVGFGMTETCAGALFNLDFPACDALEGRRVACVGQCMPGIEARITDASTGQRVKSPQEGELQVRGEVVFRQYFRDGPATATAFTSDGWFRTGDKARIDADGNIHLVGRVKDVVNINGVKIELCDIQAALETSLKHTCVVRVIGFPARDIGAATEHLVVAYVPSSWPLAAQEMVKVYELSSKACTMVSTACQPRVFAIGPDCQHLLPMSTLGKISRAKMRALVGAGVFAAAIANHDKVIHGHREEQRQIAFEPLQESESRLREDFARSKGLKDARHIHPDTPLFELGFTSIEVIRLKHFIQTRLGSEVPLITLLQNTTVRTLAAALDSLSSSDGDEDSPSFADSPSLHESLAHSSSTRSSYDPIVTLCSSGHKTPLWLIHPGVGEVLVFVGLAHEMRADNRPIFAMRARGFESGETTFGSIDEAVGTYVTAIKQKQPHGPYALAGYSYGTMLAFEIAKRLQPRVPGAPPAPLTDLDTTVPFLGSLNLPPHVKSRMRQLHWNACLSHLAQFLGLIQDVEVAYRDDDEAHQQVLRKDALAGLLQVVDKARLDELGLNGPALAHWTDVAFGLQRMAVDYEPSGRVQNIDVFHAQPLSMAATSRENWMDQLRAWDHFCQTEPRFHEVRGHHYTMLSPDYVCQFAIVLREALQARGL